MTALTRRGLFRLAAGAATMTAVPVWAGVPKATGVSVAFAYTYEWYVNGVFAGTGRHLTYPLGCDWPPEGCVELRASCMIDPDADDVIQSSTP